MPQVQAAGKGRNSLAFRLGLIGDASLIHVPDSMTVAVLHPNFR